MINIVRNILDEKNYKIINSGNSIDVYPIVNGIVEQEVYITMKQDFNSYQIFVVHRDEKKIIKKMDNFNKALSIVVVLCKKYFEHPKSNNNVIREIRKLASEGDFEKINTIFKNKLDSNSFSLSKVIDNKISLKRKEDMVDIVFKGEYIANNVKISRGYVILFNYANLLMCFNELFSELSKLLEINNEYEMLSKLYIL